MVLLPGCGCCAAGPCCCSDAFDPELFFQLTTEPEPGEPCNGTPLAKPAGCDWDAVTITITLCGETLTKTASQWALGYSGSRVLSPSRICSYSNVSFFYCNQTWNVFKFDQVPLRCACNYRTIRLRIAVSQNNFGCASGGTLRTNTCVYALVASECHNSLAIFASTEQGAQDPGQLCCPNQCPISATINWAP
jgi:hypothetical protein